MLSSRAVASLVLTLTLSPISVGADVPPADGIEFFEKRIRPLLIEHCYKCHSADTKSVKGGLRLDTRDGTRGGGESGLPSVVPHDLARSRLIESVRYENPDLQMPPKQKLSAGQVADLVAWVEMGAPDPRAAPATRPAQPVVSAADAWSFQPLKEPQVPSPKRAEGIRNPVDSFIRAALEGKGLSPAPEADRRTLIRRATYDLHGLPPTPQEVDAFAADASSDAFEKLVDRLLASPRYGERWGRHWLDLARYSDTKGYVYDREERRFVHSHNYRDWVIGALNADMPYDRFLMLQIAADQMGPADGAKLPDDLAAMGFLTVGRRFLGVTHDIIDDRIDVTMRTALGLTVACARCHDHKFDPIPTADYYALYGVFAGSTERMVRLDAETKSTPAAAEYETGLKARTDKLDHTFAAKKEALLERVRARTGDYLAAVPGAAKLPDEIFYAIMGTDELNPVIVRQWQQFLFESAKSFDPVWAPWHALAALPERDFAARAREAIRTLCADAARPLNRRVAEALRSARPASIAEVANEYGKVLAAAPKRSRAGGKGAETRPSADADDEALRLVLYGPNSPARVPAGSIADTEWFFDEDTRVTLAKLQAEIDRWNLSAAGAPRHALILEDRPEQRTPRVFRRGNPATKGEEVPRRFLSVLSGNAPEPFKIGSGRLEMAKRIAARDNPLTARVMVNRIWTYHFGAGLVTTPSDMGSRAQPPSHPELLDWLALRFMEQGWSMKSMHRLLMCSATYRQSSAEGPAAAQAADPENRLLSRANRTRLDFESMRDSLLAASGELDLTAGGRPADVTGNRRTVYAFVDRQFLPGVFRIFDFATPDLHIPQRAATTVPQQALYFMNGPFVAARAKALPARPEVKRAGDDAERIRQLYRVVFQRPPTETQVAAGLAFIAGEQPRSASLANRQMESAWTYGYAAYDSKSDRLGKFTPLPHFTGDAWQGGPSWPDGALGWVQLTATGGHSGDDDAHAAVRRWTAPRDMAIRIEGVVSHDHAAGTGIAARLVSSRAGTLGHWKVHNGKAEAKAERVELKQGDTIDFVVDFAGKLNSNMFIWTPTITALDAQPDGAPAKWSAEADFAAGSSVSTADRQDPWVRYAHVLLLANEFVFVD